MLLKSDLDVKQTKYTEASFLNKNSHLGAALALTESLIHNCNDLIWPHFTVLPKSNLNVKQTKYTEAGLLNISLS